MVRIRSTFAVLARLALAYAIAVQALAGPLAGPAGAGAIDSPLTLCRGGEGSSGPPAGDGGMPADHCAVLCQLGGGPGAQLAPPQTPLILTPAAAGGETLAPTSAAMPDGSRLRAPNARGPPRLG